MTSAVSLVYFCPSAGISSSLIGPAMAIPAVPKDLLDQIGCVVTSDSTVAGGSGATRTVNIALVPSATATATATLGAGANAVPVVSLTLTGPGINYAAPPNVVFSGGGGQNAKARALLGVVTVTVGAGGALYSATPTVTTKGGRPKTPAVLTATVVAGVITGLTIVATGSGYQSIPQIVITDPTGSGATATCTLSVVGFTLINGGSGYGTAPAVTLVPLFKSLFPDLKGDQTKPFRNLLTTRLQQYLSSPITTSVPVLS